MFNCSAPDTGNMELLHRFATLEQRAQWLAPLLDGSIRSAFAMSEPDVASSDPTNLQTTVRREGAQLVLNGRKWFITGAAHPNCRLLIVLCRNAAIAPDAAEEGPDASAHQQHSMVLVPLNSPGVQVVRNISMMHHLAPEGHCEILLRDVRVPADHLLGAWGEGFSMAQARLGPGRVHHCMRAIGQCELALTLAAERTLERQAFGKHLADFSNVQDWIAESRIEIDLGPRPAPDGRAGRSAPANRGQARACAGTHAHGGPLRLLHYARTTASPATHPLAQSGATRAFHLRTTASTGNT